MIAITGSTGKTLTKDLLAAAMGARSACIATPKSYNAELGVPLTLFGSPDDAEALVLELAPVTQARSPSSAAIVLPTAGVVTGIGSATLEEFGSREAIATHEVRAARVTRCRAASRSSRPTTTSSMSSRASTRRARGDGRSRRRRRYRADRIDADGRTHGSVSIEGATVAVVAPRRRTRPDAQRRLRRSRRGGARDRPGRGRRGDSRPRRPVGRMAMQVAIGGRTVINDAYNANPTSMASALRAVGEMAGGRRPRWAVLGPMAEIGRPTEAEHRRAGRLAADLGLDGLIVLGA